MLRWRLTFEWVGRKIWLVRWEKGKLLDIMIRRLTGRGVMDGGEIGRRLELGVPQ